MVRTLILIGLAASLVGCAEVEPPKLAVCDGKHRRLANPNGSVLPDAPIDQPKSAALKAMSQTAAVDPRSLEPCERGS